MPRLLKETLTQTIPFVEGQTVVYKLPTEGYVTRYEIDLFLDITTDSTNGGTPAEDAIARLIKSLRIEVPGARTFFGVPDGRLLKYMNLVDLGKVYEDPLPTAAGVTQTIHAKYLIYFGYNPTDPFDPTVVLPAGKLSELQLVIEWGTASDLGTGYTINSGYAKITVHEILPEEDESESDIWPEGIIQPVYLPSEKTIDEVKGELGFQFDIPTGNVIKDIFILVLDSADNRSDDEVGEVGITVPEERTTLYRVDWKALVASIAHDYGLEAPVKGLAVIEGSDISGIPFGFDTSLAKEGEYKLGFSTLRTGGKIKVLYRQVAG